MERVNRVWRIARRESGSPLHPHRIVGEPPPPPCGVRSDRAHTPEPVEKKA